MRAARAAWLFFLIQPIRSLFSGVAIAVDLNSPLFTYIPRLSHFYQRKLILLQIQCFARLTFHQLFSWANTDDLDWFSLRLQRFRISGSLHLPLTHGQACGCERSFKRMQDKLYHVHHVIMDFFAHFHIGFVFFSILCLKKKIGRNLVILGSKCTASLTREDKFHISKEPCIILFLTQTSWLREKVEFVHFWKREREAIHSWR